MKKRINVTVFLIILSINFCYSQNASVFKYVVITYEIDRNRDNHDKKQYYWIVPNDSISSGNELKKKPLYIDSFSKNSFDSCYNGSDIYLFSINTETKFDFDKDYIQEIDNLKEIISKNKKKVQTYCKKWKQGNYKETVTVYITPITGDFCSCKNLGTIDESNNIIMLPKKAFKLNDSFWKSSKAKDISRIDFLKNYNFINKDNNF